MRAALIVLVVLGCRSKEERLAEEADALLNPYLEGLCRFYVEEPCVDQSLTECGGGLSFDAISDCTTLFRLGLAGCDEATDQAVVDAAPTFEACTEQLQSFACGADPMCDGEDGHVTTDGPCGEVDEVLLAHCEAETTTFRLAR